jgi:hypothetical protein
VVSFSAARSQQVANLVGGFLRVSGLVPLADCTSAKAPGELLRVRVADLAGRVE